MPKIINHEGKLCIQSDWQAAFDKPVRYAHIFPLDAPARGYEDLIGKVVREAGDGVYLIEGTTYGRVRLPQGGKTVSIGCVEEPLSPPKRGPWRYSHGVWVHERTGRRANA